MVCLMLVASREALAFTYPTVDVWGVMPAYEPTLAMPGDGSRGGYDCVFGELPPALTLVQAIERALCANPQSRQAWASARASAAQIGQARSGYLPTLSVSVNRSRDELDTKQGSGNLGPRTRGEINAYGRNATLGWLLFDSGGRAANVEVANQTFNAALASHDGVLQAIFANTAQTYFEVLANQVALDASRDHEKAALEALQAARAKEQGGSGVRVDSLKAQTAFSQAAAERIKTEGALRLAIGTLANAMGLDARTRITLDPSASDALIARHASNDNSAHFLQDLDRLIDEGLQNQPSVRTAQAQLGAAQARVLSVTAEGLPTINLNVGRYINGRPNTQLTSTHSFETLGAVTLTIPYFEGFARNYKIKEAMASVQMREAELASARSMASLEVWRNYQMLHSETASVAASVDLMSSGQEAYDAAKARYDSGAIHIVELLDAQKDLASARHERIRAVAAWHAARLRLLASLGRAGFWALGSAPDQALDRVRPIVKSTPP